MALNETDNDTNLHVKIEFETSDDDFFISKIESLNEDYINEDFDVKELIKEEPVDYELGIEQPIDNSVTECPLSESIGSNYEDNRVDSCCNTLNEVNLVSHTNKFPSNQSGKKLTKELTEEQQIRAFACTTCSKRFKTKGNLKQHATNHCHPKQKGPKRKKRFICDVCKKECLRKSSFIVHIRSHTGERPFPCDVCGKKFPHSKYLNAHKKLHTDEKPCPCNMCDKKFRTKRELSLHMQTHTGKIYAYACDMCNKKYCQKYALNVHMRSHTGERPFPCDVCGKKFSRSSILNLHKKLHTDEKPCPCNICDKKFRTKRELSRHMQTHTGKIHACNLCDKKYCQKYALNVHMRTHTGERPFSCHICQKKFINKSNLDQHLRTHMDKNSTLAKRKKPRIRRPITKKCVLTEDTKTHLSVDFESSVVQAHTTSETALQENIPAQSKETMVDVIENNTKCYVKQEPIPIEGLVVIKTEPVISEEEDVINKNECLKSEEDFVNIKKEFVKKESIESGWPVIEPIDNSASDSLLSEIIETSGSFTCDVCNRKCNSRRNLRRHKTIHSKKKRSSYICDICKRTFLEKNYLLAHMRIHTGERPFACSKCDKKFRQRGALTKHRKTHTGQKPFSCQICDKKFSIKYNLQVHARTHTGERPYACDKCEKTFPFSSGMNRHKKYVHKLKTLP